MDFRQLGRSGIRVSTLTLGTMMFGGPTDEATAARIIDKAHEQGVNSIDTADVYCGGESEHVVGRCIAERRDRWVLATKFASPLGDGDVNARGAARKHMMRAVEAIFGKRRWSVSLLELTKSASSVRKVIPRWRKSRRRPRIC